MGIEYKVHYHVLKIEYEIKRLLFRSWIGSHEITTWESSTKLHDYDFGNEYWVQSYMIMILEMSTIDADE